MSRTVSAPVQTGATPAFQERLPESASLLLDTMRFGLALLVVVGHLTLPWFSVAWPPLLGWADAAVPGFFVLSGFMIRYVTEDRERDPRRYFISRASRMYSVLLPAIMLTLVCRTIVVHRTPAYAVGMFRAGDAAAIAGHVAAHLLFLTQGWGRAILLPPNLPLWSLGYEVPYYVLFGWIVLCRGTWRWCAVALYALLVGPQVLFLLPLWWSGCALYDVWQWSRRGKRHASSVWTIVVCIAALALMLVPLHGATLVTRIAHAKNPLLSLHQMPARATMLAYACGAVSWIGMLLGLTLSDRVTVRRNTAWSRPVRRVAEGTFTLYLFHYPLLCLIVPITGHVLTSVAETWTTLLLITAVCVTAAVPIDHLKRSMRLHLNAVFLPR